MAKNDNKFVLGTLIAGLVGYLAGLLTAPKSGKDTRQDIKNTTMSGLAEAEKKLQKGHDELNDLLVKTKGEGAKLTGAAKDEYNNAVDNALKAKQKSQEVLAALRSKDARESSDRELQYAMSNVSKAVQHLKKYLKK